jgi:hypothetical protein
MASAFFIQALNRAPLALSPNPSEGHPLHYLVRLLAFFLILGAIVHKNLARR